MLQCPACQQTVAPGYSYCPNCSVALARDPSAPAIPAPLATTVGARLGELRIERVVQRTPRGTLVAAHHLAHDRRVLARLFKPSRSLDQSAIREMEREVQLASRLTHPNILQVYELGRAEDGTLYLVMEYVDAEPLDIVLRELKSLEQELAITIASQVLSALDHAHARGVIHRAVTPASILIVDGATGGAIVKLTEFGLSKRATEDPEVVTTRLVENQLVRGTPWYLAPEALRGEETDHRVDLYAVGVTLHQMLTGTIPFEEADAGRLVEGILKQPAPPISRCRAYPFLPGLEPVVARALQKPPARRFASALAFREALERCRERGVRPGRFLLCGLLSVLLIYLMFGVRAEPAEDGRLYPRLWLGERQGRVPVEQHIGALQAGLAMGGAFPRPEPRPAPRLPALEPPADFRRALEAARRLGDARTVGEIVAAMVQIPAGEATLGSDRPDADGDERPARRVQLPLFYIDRHEVSRKRYARFLADLDVELGAPYPRPAGWREPVGAEGELPVAQVSWYDAAVYAAWAGKQLPSEAEWVRAASAADGGRWPWGDRFLETHACFKATSDGRPRPVAQGYQRGASGFGLRHASGNVAEWTADGYPGSGGHRVIKGGGFRSTPRQLRVSYRDGFLAASRADDLGFRCVYRPKEN